MLLGKKRKLPDNYVHQKFLGTFTASYLWWNECFPHICSGHTRVSSWYVGKHYIVMYMFQCLLEKKNQLLEFIAKLKLNLFFGLNFKKTSIKKSRAVTWIG